MNASTQRRCTAYCGLYCMDCIPGNSALFDAARRLRTLLEDLQFEKYAQLKAAKIAEFADYPVFERVLKEISSLQCSAPCREGGGNPNCRVRECCVTKSYEGCWECGEFEDCSLLEGLRRFHGEVITHNLRTIRTNGPDNWAGLRGTHYTWSESKMDK